MHYDDDKDRLQVFSRALRADRVTKGVTQKELAKAVGSSQQNITNLEGGKSLPRPKLLADLVAYFGEDSMVAKVSPDRILTLPVLNATKPKVEDKLEMEDFLAAFVEAVAKTDELDQDVARMYMGKIMANPANAGDLIRRLAKILSVNLQAAVDRRRVIVEPTPVEDYEDTQTANTH